MIFAAGNGTRLRPLTDHMPKALVEVGGQPMLKRVIEKLKEAGVSEAVVNVHHFSDKIKDYLSANNQFGIKIHISDESDRLLDTGGGILKAAQWLEKREEPFIVHNADILTDFDIAEMVSDHVSHHRDITLLCDKRITSRYLLFDKNMRMQGWTNESTGKVRPASVDASFYDKYAFGGVHIIEPPVIGYLRRYASERAAESVDAKDGEVFSIMDFFIEYCRVLDIGGFKPSTPYTWHDIGKPASLERANNSFLTTGEV